MAPTNLDATDCSVKRGTLSASASAGSYSDRLGCGQLRLGAYSKTAICRDVQHARIKIVATQGAAAYSCWERRRGPSSGRRHRAEPNEAVLGHELCHELGELVPLRPDFLDDDLLGLGCNPGGRGGRARSRGAVRALPPRP
jgi:hypothetical protein